MPCGVQMSGHGRVAIGRPEFRRPARAGIDDRKSGFEVQFADDSLGRRRGLRRARALGSGPSATRCPAAGAVRDSDRPRGLTSGSTRSVVEPLAQFASAGVAEADPPLGAGEPRQDGRLRQALNVDRRVELQFVQSAPQSPDAAGRLEPAARQFDQFVEGFVSPQERGRPRFDRPGQKRLGKSLAQRAGDRHRLDGVADGAEADNQDAG